MPRLQTKGGREVNKSEKDFIRGYVCAVVVLINSHGFDTVAKDVFKALGASIDKCRKSGCDEGDLETLQEYLN